MHHILLKRLMIKNWDKSTKIKNIEDKMPDIANLATKISLNAE